MALPAFQRTAFEPTESVFIALQSTSITIVPSFPLARFRTLDGTLLGPFVPLRPTVVPLWVAIQCKQKRRARLVCPDWLELGALERCLREEVGSAPFSELPFYWLEISKVLIEVAPDDIPNTDQVRSLLKSLREARQSKTRSGLSALDSLHLATPNLAALELNELRPIFSGAHIRLLQLDPKQDAFESFLSQHEHSRLQSDSYSSQLHQDHDPPNQSLTLGSDRFPSTSS